MKIRKHVALFVCLIMALQLFSFSVMASPAFKTEYEVLTASKCNIGLTEMSASTDWESSLDENGGSVTIKNKTNSWNSFTFNIPETITLDWETEMATAYIEMNVKIDKGIPGYFKFAVANNWDGQDVSVDFRNYLKKYNSAETQKVYIPLNDFVGKGNKYDHFRVQTNGNADAEITLSDIKFVVYNSNFYVETLSKSASLSWNAYEGAESYNIYQDGAFVKNVSETYATIDGLFPENTYTYQVRAKVGEEEILFLPEKLATTTGISELGLLKYEIISKSVNNTTLRMNDIETAVNRNENGNIEFSPAGDWTNSRFYINRPLSISQNLFEHACMVIKIGFSGSNSWPYRITVNDWGNDATDLNLSDYGATFDGNIKQLIIPLSAFKTLNSYLLDSFTIRTNAGTGTIEECSIVICPETISKIEERSTQETQILTWNEIENAEKYIIYRDDLKVGETTNTIFEDKGLLANVSYTYRLAAVIGGEEICATLPIVIKTGSSISDSYEIGIYKSGMKSFGNSSVFSPSPWGNNWDYLNDQYYPSKFSGQIEGSGAYRAVSWGGFAQSEFGSAIDLSDATKYNNAALSFIAYGIVNGKTGDLGMYFYKDGDDMYYSSFAVPNINATLEDGERTWVRYDIPLYQIGLTENIKKILIGKDNLTGTNNTEFAIDDIRITSLNPEVVSMYFYDENDNLIFDENGVIPKTVKKCKLRFNRELDETTINNAKILSANRDIVKNRTYNDVYKEITLNLGESLSAGEKIEIAVNDRLLSASAIGENAGNQKSVGTAYNAEKNPATEFSAEYSVAPENINYIRAINPGGYEIPSNVVIAMNVRGELEKGVADAPDMTLILAVYNSNGTLKAIESKLISKADGAGKYQTEPISAAKGDKVKVMVFENLETLKPLINSK